MRRRFSGTGKKQVSFRILPGLSAAAMTVLLPSIKIPAQNTAVRVNDFVNSIGACTHIGQGVDGASQSATAMAYAGIRCLRDDGRSAHIQDWITVYQQCGVRTALLTDHDITSTITMAKQLKAAGALLAVEGPNEPNNWPVTYQGQTSSNTTSLPIAKFQKDLYAAVKAEPGLSGIPVFHSSEAGGSQPDNCGLQFLTIPQGAGTLMPDGTVFADYANTHNYVCGTQNVPIGDNQAWNAADPTLNSHWDGLYVEYGHTWWGAGFNGYTHDQLLPLPRVTTETGWTTKGGASSITQEQQARLFLNLYLAQFARGWKYTFIYMLRDDPVQGYWGLFNTDYTPKLSGTYLHNFTTILADTGAIAIAGKLVYSLPGRTATVHDLLLQKSNGTFELVVWGENASGSSTVSVNLGTTFGKVNIFDPVQGITPAQTLTDVSSVQLSVSDHPIVVEIPNPASATAMPSGRLGSQAPELFVASTPGPFAKSLRIQFRNPASQDVSIGIYTIQGRLLKMLAAGRREVGLHTVLFGNIDNNTTVSAGIYLCRLQTKEHSIVRKLQITR
jgi:hypothetical protein